MVPRHVDGSSHQAVGRQAGSVRQTRGSAGEPARAHDLLSESLLLCFAVARADVLVGQVLVLEIHD